VEGGVHTIATIAAGAKSNSTALNAGNSVELTEFGNPEGNGGSGFGGSVIVEGPAGSKLIAVTRISSQTSGGVVAEDYNGTAVQ